MSSVRAIQLMGVSAIGVLTGLACLNNLMDYNSNFALVQHVLSMDTTFAEGNLRWRAVTNPTLHHAAYWLIIAVEGLAGGLCLAGAYKMLMARNASADIFSQSKNLALWGLGIALALYLVGFMVIGAEWFAMWQSQKWDGRQPAFLSAWLIPVVLHSLFDASLFSIPNAANTKTAEGVVEVLLLVLMALIVGFGTIVFAVMLARRIARRQKAWLQTRRLPPAHWRGVWAQSLISVGLSFVALTLGIAGNSGVNIAGWVLLVIAIGISWKCARYLREAAKYRHRSAAVPSSCAHRRAPTRCG
jgi:predicted small integral membrane protein